MSSKIKYKISDIQNLKNSKTPFCTITVYDYASSLIINELNIPFIDIHKEVFEKEQYPLKLFPFELFGHYTVDGYKKVAETIYKFTKD